MKTPIPCKIYYIKQVEELTGRNRLTLRRWWEADRFPKPVMIGSRLAWNVELLNDWIRKLIKEDAP